MNKNLKVEFCLTRVSHTSHYRYIKYRVIPKELNLFNRIFRNRWKDLYTVGFERETRIFAVSEYWQSVARLITLRDVEEYLAEQDRLIEERKSEIYNFKLQSGEYWPDEL